jgi:formate hydrogenlyase subunit 3/multisubunit Na+/H+ antiporter MnhD subunit
VSVGFWLAPALAPLIVLLGLAGRPFRAAALRLAPWTAAPALVVAVLAKPAAVDLPWLLLGARVGLDHTGRVLLGVTALVWLCAGLQAAGSRSDGAPIRFFSFYLATMSGNFGLVLALDASTFQLWYALMGFAAYGMVVHDRTPRALGAGRLYLALVVLGEVMIFAGAALLYRAAGSVLFADLTETTFATPAGGPALLLFLGAFAIKSGVVPLHVWLPPAYASAPVPGTVVLGGAMINAGLLGWLRFLPLGTPVSPVVGPACIAFGLGSAVYGAAIGVFQREPRAALAYSSVSQMGVVTVGLGTALMVPESWPLVQPTLLLYATLHGLSKGALFLGVGEAAGVGGRFRRAVLAGGLVIPALALAGAPGTSGAAAKDALRSAVHMLPPLWADFVGVLLPVVAVGTTLVMARTLLLAFSPARPEGATSAVRWWPWLVLVGIVAISPWWLPSMAGWTPAPASFAAALAAIWPVAAGALLVAAALSARRAGLVKEWPTIPAGDLWVPIERIAAGVARRLRARRAGRGGG